MDKCCLVTTSRTIKTSYTTRQTNKYNKIKTMSNLTNKVIFSACVSAAWKAIKGTELSSNPLDYIKVSAPFVLSMVGTTLYDCVISLRPTIKTAIKTVKQNQAEYENRTDKTEKVDGATKQYKMHSFNMLNCLLSILAVEFYVMDHICFPGQVQTAPNLTRFERLYAIDNAAGNQ